MTSIAHGLRLAVTALILTLAAHSAVGREPGLAQSRVSGTMLERFDTIVLAIGDGDDGRARIAVANEGMLAVLAWSEANRNWEQIQYVQLSTSVQRVLQSDVDGDLRDDLVLLLNDRTFVAYDVETGAQLNASLPSASGLQFNVESQELNGSPGHEIVISDGRAVAAFGGSSMLWQTPIAGTVVRTAPRRAARTIQHVVVSTGSEIVVLDPGTGSVVRRFGLKCDRVLAGQLDGDPEIELVCSSGSGIQVVDAVSGAVKWSTFDASAVVAALIDVSGDDRDELLGSVERSSAGGRIAIFDGESGAVVSTGPYLLDGSSPAGIRSACQPLVFALEGSSSTALDTLRVFDASTFMEHSSLRFDYEGPSAIAVADRDGDGQAEIFVQREGRISVESVSPDGTGAALTGGKSGGIAVTQLDDDPQLEYVVGDAESRVGMVTAFDGITQVKMWSAPIDKSLLPQAIVTADANGDGVPDVVVSAAGVDSGATGSFVVCFDGRTGERLWQSVSIPKLSRQLEVTDVDGDGVREVLVLSYSIGIVRLSLPHGLVVGFDEIENGYCFTVHDVDGDRKPDLILGSKDRLIALTGGKPLRERELDADWAAAEIRVADVDADGSAELIVVEMRYSTQVRLSVRSLSTFDPLWTSETFPWLGNVGQSSGLVVADVDGDGVSDVVMLASLAVRIFRADVSQPDSTPPRFPAGAALTLHEMQGSSCCASVALRWDSAKSDLSPPIEYIISRSTSGTSGPMQIIGRTRSPEFVDHAPILGTGSIYRVAVVDAAGNSEPGGMSSEIEVPRGAACGRRRGVRR